MPATLENQPTQDVYTAVCSLPPDKNTKQISFIGIGNPFYVQLYKPAPHDPLSGPVPEGIERLYPANGGDAFTGASGAFFRSAIAGEPAQIYAQQAWATDPVSLGASITSAGISNTGQIAPQVSMINGFTGRFLGDGTAITGSSAVARVGVGQYQVFFPSSLSASPDVLTSVWQASGFGLGIATVLGFTTPAGFAVNTYDVAANPADCNVAWEAIVPQ